MLASMAAFGLAATVAFAPPAPPTVAAQLQAYISSHPQRLAVSRDVAGAAISRDQYSIAPGVQTLASSGTNYDWAKLVLLSGGWPMSDTNVTVIVRWMRQENGVNDWWNRNNPLNNGLGSGGGGGLGSYANLDIAAQKVAQNLHQNSSFATVAAAFAVSAPTTIIEQAIWASPWASSHYGNGSNWHYTSVDTAQAPPSAW